MTDVLFVTVEAAMKKVLVVEDDPVNAHVLSEFLRAYGYRPLVARNGPEGIAMFSREHPDLLIVDVLLPYRNGYDVCEAVKSTTEGAATPIFLMSAIFDELAGGQRALPAERRAQAYFTKPFDLQSLIDNVQFYLGA